MWLRDGLFVLVLVLVIEKIEDEDEDDSTPSQHVFVGVTVVSRTRGTRGSPFQMPTRLADGLGPESDPGDGSHRRSPHPRFSSRNWFPRADLQEGKAA
jgi:hypothetical protein